MKSRSPSPGDKLGRFELQEKLGRGSMGVVYLAHDPLLGIQVALKMLSPTVVNPRALARFQREVLLARQVSHPGICRLFDIHQHGEVLFLTMEYVPGPSLETLIEERGLLPVGQAATMLDTLCQALSAAHAAGVIHRDLKPSNVVLQDGERPIILDFGLATGAALESITQAGTRIGTLHYMSPEVMLGRPATIQSDIYSLGVIFYRCLTGRLPFRGQDVVALKQSIESGRAVPARMFNPEVGEGLEQVLARAMALSPPERYTSVEQFRRAIRAKAPDLFDPESEGKRAPWQGDIDKSVEALMDDAQARASMADGLREVAVLFSDMVAITAYFDQHGDLAGRDKIHRHNGLLMPIIERCRGTVIKTLGDAIMATFAEAQDAVAAAVDMQRRLAEVNRDIPGEDEKIRIRIGLHHGQSLFENRDVFGDTVNVAARICTATEPDQIQISSAVHERLDEARALCAFGTRAELKGKRAPIDLYRVTWRTGAEPPAPPVGPDPLFGASSEDTIPEGAETDTLIEAGPGADGPTLLEGRPAADPGGEGPTLIEKPGEAATLIERRPTGSGEGPTRIDRASDPKEPDPDDGGH